MAPPKLANLENLSCRRCTQKYSLSTKAQNSSLAKKVFSFFDILDFGGYNAHTTMKVVVAQPVPKKVVFHTEYLNT